MRDAKTGDDLTRSILLQIILEEETGGVPMFSTQMLAQIIRFYGHAMQGMMGTYLEKNLQTFIDIQARLRGAVARALYDPKAAAPEMWTQFMSGQAPMMQGLMGNYIEQSQEPVRADAGADAASRRARVPGLPGVQRRRAKR